MNYQKHYDAIIDRAKGREKSGYTESHHIVPRCLGGGDGKSNRVNLTAEEHYVAHQLLVKIYPDVHGLAIAAMMMSRDKRNGKRSGNKLYGWLRRKSANAQSILRMGHEVSEETRERIRLAVSQSEARKEHYASMRGRVVSDEVKQKVSASHKTSEKAKAARELLFARKVGVPRSEETRRKIGAAFAGKPLSDDHRKAISEGSIGKFISEEHAANLSKALKGNKNALGAVRSEETRAKMRIAASKREEAKRAKLANQQPA